MSDGIIRSAAPGCSLTEQNFGAIGNTLNDGRAFRFAASLES